jgi:glycerol-1-phosphate dehydrogenase [NAD(P)+]
MMMYLHGGDWRVIKDVLSRVGAPTTAKELGIKDRDIIKAMTIAHTIRPDRYTILGESGITADAAESVARITGVIA